MKNIKFNSKEHKMLGRVKRDDVYYKVFLYKYYCKNM